MPIFATSNHTTRLITPPPTTIQQNAATTLALTMAALCESNARCSAQSYVLPDGTSPTKAKTFMEYMQEHTSTGFASAFHSGKLKDWETHKTKFTSLANDFLEREVLLPPHQRTRNPPPPPPHSALLSLGPCRSPVHPAVTSASQKPQLELPPVPARTSTHTGAKVRLEGSKPLDPSDDGATSSRRRLKLYCDASPDPRNPVWVRPRPNFPLHPFPPRREWAPSLSAHTAARVPVPHYAVAGDLVHGRAHQGDRGGLLRHHRGLPSRRRHLLRRPVGGGEAEDEGCGHRERADGACVAHTGSAGAQAHSRSSTCLREAASQARRGWWECSGCEHPQCVPAYTEWQWCRESTEDGHPLGARRQPRTKQGRGTGAAARARACWAEGTGGGRGGGGGSDDG